jgi:hypothetical protein
MRLKNRIGVIIFLICLLSAIVSGYEFDANDFAAEVVSYDAGEGAGAYTFSEVALGRPSVNTYYNDADWPVVPVYPAYIENDFFSVVTVGEGGHLILKFNHRVGDDENNPYGIDFIVFGNAMIAAGGYWSYGDPYEMTITSGEVNNEYGLVSVSQDSMLWYSFEEGPFADSFAPTLGRVFNPNEPCDVYPGWENLWWGEVTDATLPIDPNIENINFMGKTVAELCYSYGKSAGGTGFDLKWLPAEHYSALTEDPVTGEKWIQYIMIEYTGLDPNHPFPEVDAVSDVSCCGDYKRPFPAGDINRDCSVGYDDLVIFTGYWLLEVDGAGIEAEAADMYEDGVIDFLDFAILGSKWLFKSGN